MRLASVVELTEDRKKTLYRLEASKAEHKTIESFLQRLSIPVSSLETHPECKEDSDSVANRKPPGKKFSRNHIVLDLPLCLVRIRIQNHHHDHILKHVAIFSSLIRIIIKWPHCTFLDLAKSFGIPRQNQIVHLFEPKNHCQISWIIDSSRKTVVYHVTQNYPVTN